MFLWRQFDGWKFTINVNITVQVHIHSAHILKIFCVLAWRCDKVMDIYSGCALCLPNLTSPALHQPTHTPPLCIEIKVNCSLSWEAATAAEVFCLWITVTQTNRAKTTNHMSVSECVFVCVLLSWCFCVGCVFSLNVASCRPPNMSAKTSRPKCAASVCTNTTR